jgi:hypothetical protein
VSVSKIKAANEAASERLKELQRELEAQLAATLALKTEVGLAKAGGLPVPAPVPIPLPIEAPPATPSNRVEAASVQYERWLAERNERRLAELRPRYEERLRAMGLTRAEIEQVLRIMAEEGANLLLAAVRSGGQRSTREDVAAHIEKQRATLQELLGPQGAELLTQYQEETRFTDSAVRAVERIERAGGQLSPGGEAAAMALAHGIFTEKFDSTLLSGDRAWTLEHETAMRTARGALWTQWLGQEGATVSAEERTRIKSWFDLVTEERIGAVGEMVRSAVKRKQEGRE